jgi:hypothetical protein
VCGGFVPLRSTRLLDRQPASIPIFPYIIMWGRLSQCWCVFSPRQNCYSICVVNGKPGHVGKKSIIPCGMFRIGHYDRIFQQDRGIVTLLDKRNQNQPFGSSIDSNQYEPIRISPNLTYYTGSCCVPVQCCFTPPSLRIIPSGTGTLVDD